MIVAALIIAFFATGGACLLVLGFNDDDQP